VHNRVQAGSGWTGEGCPRREFSRSKPAKSQKIPAEKSGEGRDEIKSAPDFFAKTFLAQRSRPKNFAGRGAGWKVDQQISNLNFNSGVFPKTKGDQQNSNLVSSLREASGRAFYA
jgi:hypothetical protein